MNTYVTGNTIRQLRETRKLTQAELAEKIGVSSKTISKWETGKSLPDSSIMLELCSTLDITVNDLLSGEVVKMDNCNKELENKLIEMVKEKEQADKRLLALEWVIGILSMIILFVPIFIGALLPMEDWLRIVLVFSGFIPAIIGFFFAIRLEQVAGYYACKECGHRYVPAYKAMTFAPHMGTTRFMRCPVCGKKSLQKKVLSKE